MAVREVTVLGSFTLYALAVAARALCSPAESLQTSSDARLKAAVATDAVRDGSSMLGCSLELRQLRRAAARASGNEEIEGADVREDDVRPIKASEVVFVKFHQVGGTSAHETIGQLVEPAARDENHVTISSGHTSSRRAAAWVKDGSVPPSTFATTLLRHPVEKYLSAFFKHQFPSVLKHDESEIYDHYNPWPEFDHLFGPGENRSLEAMHNLSAVQEAITMNIQQTKNDSCVSSQLACEYTKVLGDEHLSDSHRARAAITLLRQFAVVGITERFGEWVQNICIGLGDLTQANCTAGLGKAEEQRSARKSVGHPVMADFPDHFIEDLSKFLEPDMAVYREAQRLADLSPKQQIRFS